MIARASQDESTELVESSDRQIHAAATSALAASQYVSLRRLHCRVFDGVVEISGTVSSFYLKQLAQAAILPVNRAGLVRNLVQVGPASMALAAGGNCDG